MVGGCCSTPHLCRIRLHDCRLCHIAHSFSLVLLISRSLSLSAGIAITCPATMQYGTCVSSCRSRCSALSVPQHCGEECEEGCVCPQGTFYNQQTHTCVHRYCWTDGTEENPETFFFFLGGGDCPRSVLLWGSLDGQQVQIRSTKKAILSKRYLCLCEA